MAPELLRGESANTDKSDIFALGILIYEIYSRKDPYEGEDYPEVLRQICDPRINKRPPVPENCSIKLAEMMNECLAAKPAARPTAAQIDLALKVEGSVKERVTKLEQLNTELAEANKKIALASSTQLVSLVSFENLVVWLPCARWRCLTCFCHLSLELGTLCLHEP